VSSVSGCGEVASAELASGLNHSRYDESLVLSSVQYFGRVEEKGVLSIPHFEHRSGAGIHIFVH